MPKRKKLIGLGLAAVLLVSGVLLALANVDRRPIPEALRTVLVKKPVTLDAVTLIDHHGSAITTDWFTGHWTFVFFGFTHCHDICPATLAQMAAIDKHIVKDYPAAPEVRYLFIGVDPQRDSQEQLKNFVSGFGSNFFGATGDLSRIGALERQFSVFHRTKSANSSGDYQVNHSAEMFVVDPAGRIFARFVPPVDPSVAARQFALLADVYAKANGSAGAS